MALACREAELLRKHISKLQTALQHPVRIGNQLWGKGMIDLPTKQSLVSLKDDQERATKLLDHLVLTITHHPPEKRREMLETILEIFKEYTPLDVVVQLMMQDYEESASLRSSPSEERSLFSQGSLASQSSTGSQSSSSVQAMAGPDRSGSESFSVQEGAVSAPSSLVQTQDSADDGCSDTDTSGFSEEKAVRLLCCCGKCSIKEFVKNGCPSAGGGKLRKFPLLSLDRLSHGEKIQLIARLHDESEGVADKFATLVIEVMRVFKSKVDVTELVVYLLSLKATRLHRNLVNKRILESLEPQLSECDSVSQVFKILATMWSWFNHSLLGRMISAFPVTDIVKAKYDSYVGDCLTPYLRRSVFEIPGDSFGPDDDVPGFEKFVLKVNDSLAERTKAEQLPRMQRDVARALDIEPDALILQSVDEGCFQIKFLLLSDIINEVLPLSLARIAAFSCLEPRVTSLECHGVVTSILPMEEPLQQNLGPALTSHPAPEPPPQNLGPAMASHSTPEPPPQDLGPAMASLPASEPPSQDLGPAMASHPSPEPPPQNLSPAMASHPSPEPPPQNLSPSMASLPASEPPPQDLVPAMASLPASEPPPQDLGPAMASLPASEPPPQDLGPAMASLPGSEPPSQDLGPPMASHPSPEPPPQNLGPAMASHPSLEPPPQNLSPAMASLPALEPPPQDLVPAMASLPASEPPSQDLGPVMASHPSPEPPPQILGPPMASHPSPEPPPQNLGPAMASHPALEPPPQDLGPPIASHPSSEPPPQNLGPVMASHPSPEPPPQDLGPAMASHPSLEPLQQDLGPTMASHPSLEPPQQDLGPTMASHPSPEPPQQDLGPVMASHPAPEPPQQDLGSAMASHLSPAIEFVTVPASSEDATSSQCISIPCMPEFQALMDRFHLVFKFFVESFESSKMSIGDIKAKLIDRIGVFRLVGTIGNTWHSLLEGASAELDSAITVRGLFQVLENYCSWFNYELLDTLAQQMKHLVGGPVINVSKLFTDKLHHFLKCPVKMLPPTTHSSQRLPGFVELVVSFGSDRFVWERESKQLCLLKSSLARAFFAEMHALLLTSINQKRNEVRCLLAESIALNEFPPPRSRIREWKHLLSDWPVAEISCEGQKYSLDVNEEEEDTSFFTLPYDCGAPDSLERASDDDGLSQATSGYESIAAGPVASNLLASTIPLPIPSPPPISLPEVEGPLPSFGATMLNNPTTAPYLHMGPQQDVMPTNPPAFPLPDMTGQNFLAYFPSLLSTPPLPLLPFGFPANQPNLSLLQAQGTVHHLPNIPQRPSMDSRTFPPPPFTSHPVSNRENFGHPVFYPELGQSQPPVAGYLWPTAQLDQSQAQFAEQQWPTLPQELSMESTTFSRQPSVQSTTFPFVPLTSQPVSNSKKDERAVLRSSEWGASGLQAPVAKPPATAAPPPASMYAERTAPILPSPSVHQVKPSQQPSRAAPIFPSPSVHQVKPSQQPSGAAPIVPSPSVHQVKPSQQPSRAAPIVPSPSVHQVKPSQQPSRAAPIVPSPSVHQVKPSQQPSRAAPIFPSPSVHQVKPSQQPSVAAAQMLQEVCRACLSSYYQRRDLLENGCFATYGAHDGVPLVRASWDFKYHVVVEVRPLPLITLRPGSWFSLCRKTNCNSPRCTYAHNFPEREQWNKELQAKRSMLASRSQVSSGVVKQQQDPLSSKPPHISRPVAVQHTPTAVDPAVTTRVSKPPAPPTSQFSAVTQPSHVSAATQPLTSTQPAAIPTESHEPPKIIQADSHNYRGRNEWKLHFTERVERTLLVEKEVVEPLTVFNYQDKFYKLLCYEEKEHIDLLTRRCDSKTGAKYTFVVSDDTPLNSSDTFFKGHRSFYEGRRSFYEGHRSFYEGRRSFYEGHRSFYEDHNQVTGYVLGMTGDQIAYATQASQGLFFVDEHSLSDICRVDIPPVNHSVVSNELFLSLSQDAFARLKKQCPLIQKSQYSVSVEFEVKHSYFDTLHRAVINVPQHMIRKLLPKKDAFIQHVPRISMNWSCEFFKLELDPYQMSSLQAIIQSTPLAPVIIAGPFGSGKTRILARAAYQLIEEGLRLRRVTRILVCAHHSTTTQTYVLNYLQPVYQHRWNRMGVKLVQMDRQLRLEQAQELYKSISQLRQERHIYKEAKFVVLVTTFTSSLQLLSVLSNYFTHILLDEAAQVREPEAIAPLSLATKEAKVVVTGDAMQVGPALLVLGKEAQKHGLSVSLLERLKQQYKSMGSMAESHLKKLNINYRCHASLMQFLSELFYDSSLKCRSVVNDHPMAHFPLIFCCSDTNDHANPGSDPDYRPEIQVLLDHLRWFLVPWPAQWGSRQMRDVCVISSTRPQLNLIRKELHAVSTVSQVRLLPTYQLQGHECRAVFLTTGEPLDEKGCSYNPTKSLCNPYVFNTALSRAKSLVVAVGNPFTLLRVEEIMGKGTESHHGFRQRSWKKYIKMCVEKRTFYFSSTISKQEQFQVLAQLRKKVGAMASHEDKPSTRHHSVDDELRFNPLVEKPVTHWSYVGGPKRRRAKPSSNWQVHPRPLN